MQLIWADDPCYYVSVIDGPRYALLAGPFRTHEQALSLVDKTRDIACKVDPKGWFYAYGTVKMINGHRTGSLNKHLGLD
jgi:hypothetical protein